MKRDSFLAAIYARVFPVVFFALIGGGFWAVRSTGFFSAQKAHLRISDPAVFDTSDYRPRAKEAFVWGAGVGAALGVIIQVWRPRKPVADDSSNFDWLR